MGATPSNEANGVYCSSCSCALPPNNRCYDHIDGQVYVFYREHPPAQRYRVAFREDAFTLEESVGDACIVTRTLEYLRGPEDDPPYRYFCCSCWAVQAPSDCIFLTNRLCNMGGAPTIGLELPGLPGPDQEPAAISVSNREVRQQQQQQQQQQGGRQPELPTRAARTHLGGQCSDGGIPSCPPDHGGWFPALGRLHAPHQQQQQQQLALCSASAAAPHGPQQKQQEQAQQDTEQDTRAVSSNPEGGARPRNVPLHGNEYGSSNGCEYDSDLDEQLEPPEYEAGYCYRRGDRVVWRGRHYVCRLSHQAPEGGPLQLVGVEEQEGERGESGSREEGQGVVESEGRRREDAQGAAGLGLGGCGGGSGGHGACDAAGRATRAAVRRRVCWELVEPEAQLQSGVGDAQGSSSSPSRPEAPGSSTPSAGCQPQSQSHPQPPAGPRCCCTGGGTGAPQALGAGRREPHAGRPIEGPVPLPHFGLPALGGSGSADDGDPSAEDGEGDGEADGGGKGRERAVTLLQPLAAGQPLSVGGVQAAANTSIATALAAAAPAPAACASAVAGDPHVWSRAC